MYLTVFYSAAFAFTNLCFHMFVFGGDVKGAWFSCLLSAFIGALAGLISKYCKRPGKIISFLLIMLHGFFASVQLIYFRVFGNLMRISQISMGGDVFSHFAPIISSAVLKNLIQIILLFLPAIIYACRKYIGRLYPYLPDFKLTALNFITKIHSDIIPKLKYIYRRAQHFVSLLWFRLQETELIHPDPEETEEIKKKSKKHKKNPYRLAAKRRKNPFWIVVGHIKAFAESCSEKIKQKRAEAPLKLVNTQAPCSCSLCLRFSSAILAAVLLVLTAFSGILSQKGQSSDFDIFADSSVSTDFSYQHLGLSGALYKDMVLRNKNNKALRGTGGLGEAVGTYSSNEYNVSNSDFDSLAASTDDETLKALDEYFKGAAPTSKNMYSGILSGYNLITICAESFTPYIIDEELTPTLYKLSNNGIIFNNYYGSFQSLTSDGEYTMCTGLFPDMYSSNVATSFEESISKYLPYCLGRSLQGKGYSCFSYHNNIGEFYSRNLSHPNMGYTFKSADSGLDIKLTNPASDLELFEQSLPDYTELSAPFHVHYMTYSAHYPYNNTNAMSVRNSDAVKDLPYSSNVKAFIASNLELEKGLEYLMDTLEEKGLANKTVIVLTNDHYPYGLTDEEYNELAGKEIDTAFEKYKNSLICYVPGMNNPMHVEEYCCTADILPTLLNLFGVKYDSRLLMGKDIFSDGVHMAVLFNQSFITDSFKYDADAGLLPDDTKKDAKGYTEADYKKYVQNLFTVSSDVISHDYYGHAFGGEGNGDFEIIEFSDIIMATHKSAIQYIIGCGLMKADEEHVFGGNRGAEAAELKTALLKLDQSYTFSSALTDDTALTHVNFALITASFAKHRGIKLGISPAEIHAAKESYPKLSNDEIEAVLWACKKAVMNKTADYVYENRNLQLNRFQLATYLSYLCTRVLVK